LEYPLWIQDDDLANKTEGYTWKDREGYAYRAGYKPPAKTDLIFLLSLLLQSQKEGWREEVITTKYRILQLCGISRNEIWYKRLEDSLKRWNCVKIEFEGTFYDGKEYKIMNFGIIDDWCIEKESRRLIVKFNRFWLQKIKESSFFQYINFEQIKTLRSPLTVRLYEILIKNFQGRTRWEIESQKLAQKIPMKEQYPSDIIPKIKAAVNRINGNTDLKIGLTIDRSQKGKALFLFEKLEAEKEAPQKAKKPPAIPNEQLLGLIELLPAEQQSNEPVLAIIARAYQEFGPEYVANNIQYANENASSNYQAYLQNSLIENWGSVIQARNEKGKQKKAMEGSIMALAEKIRSKRYTAYQNAAGQRYVIQALHDADPRVDVWSIATKSQKGVAGVKFLRELLEANFF
jgi:hypothetical protein